MTEPSTPPNARQVAPFAATITLSAGLLFLVQPIIAKQILPWFGGSTAVWVTCLVFFQVALLGGYAYADLGRRLGPRRQSIVHLALLVTSLLTLPILAPDSARPAGDADPIAAILVLLGRTVGLPYFMLSTTTPLLQSWYFERHRAAVPYRLFALSNLASLGSLLAFPFLLEPAFDSRELSIGWSIAYAVFVVACAAIGVVALRRKGDATPATAAEVSAAGGAADASRPPWRDQALWAALAALGSAMLLCVSSHITQNLASVPLLWVVPLALYLLTFVLCFDHPRWAPRWPVVVLALLAAPAMAWQADSLKLAVALPLFLGGMFVACLFVHGELARRKPDPRHLTRFYLMLSAGGAVGALLVALAAPYVFDGYYEIHLTLVLLAAAGAVALPGWWRIGGAAAVIATFALCAHDVADFRQDVRAMKRDFFGVVRTRNKERWGSHYRVMVHGAIKHGGQILDPGHDREPSDYFGPTSGYGRTFTALNDVRPAPRKVGIIGLGAGVAAGYSRKGDDFTFYEISPAVIEVESEEFTFRNGSPAKNRLVLGDGRLSLERAKDEGYDLLGVDAFSGDSIPMHLVTREAMQLYLRHLKPDGVLVFQATNRYIDLLPLLGRHAKEHGLHARYIHDFPPDHEDFRYWRESTLQVVMCRDNGLFDHERFDDAHPLPDRPELPTYTDSYHNLWRILK